MPWYYAVAERDHEIQNATSAEKIALLGNYLRLGPETRVLDLACGKGGPAIAPRLDVRLQRLRHRACARVRRGGAASASKRPGSAISSRSSKRTRTPFRSSRGPGTLRSASVRPSSGTTSAGRSRRSRPRCGPAATSSSASRTGRQWPLPRGIDDQGWVALRETVARFESAGLALEGLIASSEQDWDHYESQHWRALEEWLAANPRDPTRPRSASGTSRRATTT